LQFSLAGRDLVESVAGRAIERAKGHEMPEINAATGALTIPIWAVGAVAAVFVVLMMLAIAQSGTAVVMNTLFRASIGIAAVSAGWIYFEHTQWQERTDARRALDERVAALLARAVAPGSPLSCLNELAGDAVEAACEKAVFASPESVSAAVNYVTAEFRLLADGAAYATRADTAYWRELAQVKVALQLDRFGIVAHVLAGQGCTAETCDAAGLIGDSSRVLANLRDHVFDSYVEKSTVAWNAPPMASAAAVATTAGAAARVATPVSPQYDFPSASSIPPVNIMAPEPAPRSAAATGQAAPSATTPRQQAAAPLPPRHPSQARPPAAAASRPAATRPSSAPVAAGEAPTDGAGTPSSQSQ
jgi:hypothetical protein